MRLNALLMSRSQQSQQLIAVALDKLGIDHESCTSAHEAVELLGHQHYSAVVVDYDVPDSATVARLARLGPSNSRPVVFLMIGVTTEIKAAFAAGANFVLYKPLVLEQVERSLRAGRGFMRADRRHSLRHRLETVAYLRFGDTEVPAVVLDINEDGISIHTIRPVPALSELPFHFVLPGTTHSVKGKAELIWTDDGGRAGLLFDELPPASKKHLDNWLLKRTPGRRPTPRISDLPEKARRPVLSH